MSRIEITVHEIITLLNHSSLPTIIVEGNDDLIVYRTIETALNEYSFSILPVGGREKALEVFNRRGEIKSTQFLFFIVDKDCWVYSDVPKEFQHDAIICTDGYSIENDIIVDSNIICTIAGDHKYVFEEKLDKFTYWYALAVDRFLRGEVSVLKESPDKILSDEKYQQYVILKNDEEYPESLKNKIRSDYIKLIRGKSLLSLIVRVLNNRQNSARYDTKAIFEMVSVRPGDKIKNIISKIKELIAVNN